MVGYRDSRQFTIDHTQVGGADLANFPIVVRGTYPELKSAANGGQIQNMLGALPCDFVVGPNADGQRDDDNAREDRMHSHLSRAVAQVK